MKDEPANKTMTFACTQTEKETIEDYAKKEQRSASNYMRKITREHIQIREGIQQQGEEIDADNHGG